MSTVAVLRRVGHHALPESTELIAEISQHHDGRRQPHGDRVAIRGVVARPIWVACGGRHAGLGESAPILTHGRAQICEGTGVGGDENI